MLENINENVMIYGLNEELHIPDKENVDLLVDDVVKEIYKGTSSVLYLHMPFTGNTEPGNVSVTVELRNVNKYCKWIGDNNRVNGSNAGSGNNRRYSYQLWPDVDPKYNALNVPKDVLKDN